jgi:PPOX class probable FMN-dependent enzyme
VTAPSDPLDGLYPPPSDLVVRKTLPRLDRYARRFIELSPFVCIATTDADGHCDASPRGDAPGFVRVVDDLTLLLPDRVGNNRLDSLRNLQRAPGIGMLFLVPGIDDALRVNGRARLVLDRASLEPLAVSGRTPRSALRVDVDEVFFHCGRAVKRARLWDARTHVPPGTMPTIAQIVTAQLDEPPIDPEAARREAETLY